MKTIKLESQNIDDLEKRALDYLWSCQWKVKKPIHVCGFFRPRFRIILREITADEKLQHKEMQAYRFIAEQIKKTFK